MSFRARSYLYRCRGQSHYRTVFRSCSWQSNMSNCCYRDVQCSNHNTVLEISSVHSTQKLLERWDINSERIQEMFIHRTWAREDENQPPCCPRVCIVSLLLKTSRKDNSKTLILDRMIYSAEAWETLSAASTASTSSATLTSSTCLTAGKALL
jgi:hypothetical protein